MYLPSHHLSMSLQNCPGLSVFAADKFILQCCQAVNSLGREGLQAGIKSVLPKHHKKDLQVQTENTLMLFTGRLYTQWGNDLIACCGHACGTHTEYAKILAREGPNIMGGGDDPPYSTIGECTRIWAVSSSSLPGISSLPFHLFE